MFEPDYRLIRSPKKVFSLLDLSENFPVPLQDKGDTYFKSRFTSCIAVNIQEYPQIMFMELERDTLETKVMDLFSYEEWSNSVFTDPRLKSAAEIADKIKEAYPGCQILHVPHEIFEMPSVLQSQNIDGLIPLGHPLLNVELEKRQSHQFYHTSRLSYIYVSGNYRTTNVVEVNIKGHSLPTEESFLKYLQEFHNKNLVPETAIYNLYTWFLQFEPHALSITVWTGKIGNTYCQLQIRYGYPERKRTKLNFQ